MSLEKLPCKRKLPNEMGKTICESVKQQLRDLEGGYLCVNCDSGRATEHSEQLVSQQNLCSQTFSTQDVHHPSSFSQEEQYSQPFFPSENCNSYNDCDYRCQLNSPIPQQNIDAIPLLAQNVYFLNKSSSKWLAVGLCIESVFDPVIRIMGNKKQCITLSEDDWKKFISYKYTLIKCFIERRNIDSVRCNNLKMSFEWVNGNRRTLKLERGKEYLYISYDGLQELWKLTELVAYRLELLKRLDYKSYYNDMIEWLSKTQGDLKTNMKAMANGNVSEHSFITEELMIFGINKVLFDLELYSVVIS